MYFDVICLRSFCSRYNCKSIWTVGHHKSDRSLLRVLGRDRAVSAFASPGSITRDWPCLCTSCFQSFQSPLNWRVSVYFNGSNTDKTKCSAVAIEGCPGSMDLVTANFASCVFSPDSQSGTESVGSLTGSQRCLDIK